MRKKILIGSIFVLTLLLLMPSITAVQVNTNQLEFKDNLGPKNNVKFPNLNYLILHFLTFRLNNFRELREFSADYVIDWHWMGHWEVHYPILYYYSLRIFMKWAFRYIFWASLSILLGLNWEFEFLYNAD